MKGWPTHPSWVKGWPSFRRFCKHKALIQSALKVCLPGSVASLKVGSFLGVEIWRKQEWKKTQLSSFSKGLKLRNSTMRPRLVFLLLKWKQKKKKTQQEFEIQSWRTICSSGHLQIRAGGGKHSSHKSKWKQVKQGWVEGTTRMSEIIPHDAKEFCSCTIKVLYWIVWRKWREGRSKLLLEYAK